MARVFLAERADGQFEHRVALKLLRPGIDSDVDVQRFRAERQILASLNHPNIARLLDGGVTDDGLPYLVLEYVDGQPLDRYCEAHALSTRQRLELFLTGVYTMRVDGSDVRDVSRTPLTLAMRPRTTVLQVNESLWAWR